MNSNPSASLLDERQLLTPYAEKEIVTRASLVNCECPKHLVEILQKIRSFAVYEQSCELKSPQDQDIHRWLYQAAVNLDQMLSGTIIQLARMEGMVDENNQIVNHPNVARD